MKRSSYGEPDYAFGQAMLTLRTTIGLTQSGVAEHLGVSRKAVGEWEAGLNYPQAAHHKAFIALAIERQAFPAGREEEEIRALWQAARRKVPLDEAWLAALLSREEIPPVSQPSVETSGTTSVLASPARGGPQVDWADALTVTTFYGREWELNLLTSWIDEEHCRVVSVLGHRQHRVPGLESRWTPACQWGRRWRHPGVETLRGAARHLCGDVRGSYQLGVGAGFCPDGTHLASGSWDGTVRLWDVATGNLRQTLTGHTERVRAVAWSPDGLLLASCGFDQRIWLWDVDRSSYRTGLHGHTAGVYDIAFTPDSRSLLSGSEDGTLRVWDVERGQCVHIMQGYAVSLYDVALSPDGSWLASAGSNTLVTIWDVEGLTPSRLLRGHRSLVCGVAWSPDGRVAGQ